MHYYQFNIGDYAKDTSHLTEMEDLAYRRMLDLCYRTERALPLDIQEIARLIRMRTHCECIATVLRDFFDEHADGYKNRRVDAELEKAYSKSAKARESAKSRWSKNNDLRDENAMRTQCESDATQDTRHITQDTIHKEEKKKATGVAASRDAIDFSPLCMTAEQVDEVKRIRKKNKGGALTQRVVNGLAAEFEQAARIGWGPEDILSEWELRGWKSFKAEWIKPRGESFDGLSAISRKNAQNLQGEW